ncbi:MAG: YceI family protein [Planctomycetota bacterium]|jgi:rhodanese-related sulfurtransferase
MTLRSWIDESRDFLLLDVLPAEAHEEWRIPSSRNAAVYEVTFLDQVAELGAAKDQPVVVYCSSPRSHASEDAAERLREAGYAEVVRFEGGREAWSEAGLAAEGTAASAPWEPGRVVPPEDGRYGLDPEKSLIHWTGRNAGNSHYGTIRFASGRVDVEGGLPGGGEAVADMKSIEVDDLDGEMATVLIRHLATADFFLVERYPTATFRLSGAEPAEGEANVSLRGEMELRGAVHPIEFPAVFAASGDGLAIQGSFEFDRTNWGSRYGSTRFYERLGGHRVNDSITIQIRLVARR